MYGMMDSATVITLKMQQVQDGHSSRLILLMILNFRMILLCHLLKMRGTRLWKSSKICILMNLHITLMLSQLNYSKALDKDMILHRTRPTNWHRFKKQLFFDH